MGRLVPTLIGDQPPVHPTGRRPAAGAASPGAQPHRDDSALLQAIAGGGPGSEGL